MKAEIGDVRQTEKVIPLITCEISFGQNVCEMVRAGTEEAGKLKKKSEKASRS